jgi:hypothetical protein
VRDANGSSQFTAPIDEPAIVLIVRLTNEAIRRGAVILDELLSDNMSPVLTRRHQADLARTEPSGLAGAGATNRVVDHERRRGRSAQTEIPGARRARCSTSCCIRVTDTIIRRL